MAVYLVENKDGSKRLIETRTKAGAINHVANGDYKATALNTSSLVENIRSGLVVETVAAEAEGAVTAPAPIVQSAEEKAMIAETSPAPAAPVARPAPFSAMAAIAGVAK